MKMDAEWGAYILDDNDGEAYWFAGSLMVLKAGGDQTGGRFTIFDQHVPGGYAVPWHRHADDDEGWYMLEGEATFYCGDEQFSAGPGAWVFVPKGVPHTFRFGPAGGRLLVLGAPARFADFVREASEPAPKRTLPPPAPLDIERLASVAARYDIEILGPPPD